MSHDKRPVNLHKIPQSPPLNCNARFVACPGTNTVVLFGGFDDLDCLDSNVYLLDTKTMRWSIDKSHKGLFREGHSANYIGDGNVLVFGGLVNDDDPSHYPTRSSRRAANDEDTAKKTSLMLIYNLFTRTWTTPPDFVLDNAPQTRSRHASCLSPDGKKVYISGGVINSNTLDDLYSYDFTTGTWYGPFTFVHRFDHYITVYEDKIYSFGGLNKNMNRVRDRVTFFDLKDSTVGEISMFTNHETKYTINEERYFDLSMNSPIKLNVTLSKDTFDQKGTKCFLSYYDLKSLKHVHLFELSQFQTAHGKTASWNLFDFTWIDAIISENMSLLVFGCPLDKADDEYVVPDVDHEDEPMTMADSSHLAESASEIQEINEDHDNVLTDDGKLSTVFEIELSELALNHRTAEDSGEDLSASFKHLLHTEELADFEIYCFGNKEERQTQEEFEFDHANPKEYNGLVVLKVHKLVLYARWPYFKNVIDSGMVEAVYSRMFIPETVEMVKGLVYYLYTNSIVFQPPYITGFSLVDYSELLVISNFYALVGLRGLILNKIYSALNLLTHDGILDSEPLMEAILQLWSNVYTSNESLLIGKLNDILRANWAGIAQSTAFSKMSKHAILTLVHICAVDSDTATSPRRSGRVNLALGASESSSAVSSPNRDCKSPFLQNSRTEENNSNTDDTLRKLPILQHLSDELQGSLI